MMAIGFNKGDLQQLRNLKYEDAKTIVEKMPGRMLASMFASQGSPDQIKQLFAEYQSFLGVDDVKVRNRYKKKVKLLCKALRKCRKSHLIPMDLRK